MLKRRLNLAFDLITAEQWNRVLIELHPILVVGHDLIDERVRFFISLFAVNQQFTHVFTEVVANGPQNDAVFLIEQLGCGLFSFGALHGFP